MPGTRTNTFRKRHRLRHDREFQAVYEAGVRKQRGPLMVSVCPNEIGEPRLGLSVGTRVGVAAARNRCKRLIREAFRLERANLPASPTGCYDIVVGVRASRSDPKTTTRTREVLPPLAELRAILVDLVSQCDAECRNRARKAGPKSGDAQ